MMILGRIMDESMFLAEVVELPSGLLQALAYVLIAAIIANGIIIVATIVSVRDSSQQKQNTRDAIIKNERTNILHGIEMGWKLHHTSYQTLKQEIENAKVCHTGNGTPYLPADSE